MTQPIADMRVRSDTSAYIGPKANFPVGFLQVSGSSLHQKAPIKTSGATTDLSTVDGDFVDISGNATITSFGTVPAGVRKWLRFTGTPTLVHNATSLILLTGANIVCQINDRVELVSLGTGLGSGSWLCL